MTHNEQDDLIAEIKQKFEEWAKSNRLSVLETTNNTYKERQYASGYTQAAWRGYLGAIRSSGEDISNIEAGKALSHHEELQNLRAENARMRRALGTCKILPNGECLFNKPLVDDALLSGKEGA